MLICDTEGHKPDHAKGVFVPLCGRQAKYRVFFRTGATRVYCGLHAREYRRCMKIQHENHNELGSTIKPNIMKVESIL